MIFRIGSWKTLNLALGMLILLVGVSITIPYVFYIPPNFSKGFLRGKESFFYGLYALGFYLHIASAPIVLLCGLIQTSSYCRRRWRTVHVRSGQVYVWLTLLAVAPGGLIIAFRALGGWPSIVGFATLSLLVWWFTYQGWKSARAGRYSTSRGSHGVWMRRSFILICSAVLLRLMSSEASRWGIDPKLSYPIIAWLSWLPSLLFFELVYFRLRKKRVN